MDTSTDNQVLLSEINMSNSSNTCELYHVKEPDKTNLMVTMVITGIYYVAGILFGVFGNGMIIYLTLKQRNLQTVQNILIFNLSVANLLICVTSGPLTPTMLIYKQWFFGAFLCHVFPWAQGTSIVVSTFTLTVIAIDRCMLVTMPLKPHITDWLTWRVIIPTLWLSAGVLITPYGYFMKIEKYPNICGEFCDEGWPENKAPQQVFAIFVLLIEFVVPFGITAVCYVAVWLKLRAHTGQKLAKLERDHVCRSSVDSIKRNEILRKRVRSTSILIGMVIVFFVAYLPHNTVTILMEYTTVINVYNPDLYLLSLLAHAMTMISIIVNPILYAFLNPTIRNDLFKRTYTNVHRDPTALGTRNNNRGQTENVPLASRNTLTVRLLKEAHTTH